MRTRVQVSCDAAEPASRLLKQGLIVSSLLVRSPRGNGRVVAIFVVLN